MGAIGRYIDTATDAAIDRIITAQNWTAGSVFNEKGERCLLGHGNNYADLADPLDMEMHYKCNSLVDSVIFPTGICKSYKLPAMCFDKLVERRGLAIAVAMVKKRAGKRNAITLTNPPTREEAMR